ncbi:PKD-like family lipoprotein [Sphingobacterium sp. HJSM2_6]|uniref:PKD-like family lipoprotein n=1 Tax=Sphingobacterium sp. HJSM2_6 TaxID=3366264 RepID=UPI003BC8C390
MKNIIYSLIGFLTVLMFAACSKDSGSYTYKTINEISITNVLEGDHNTERIYNLPFKDTMTINPIVVGSISGTNHSKLTFEWKVNHEVISNTLKFNYVADKEYGKLPGEFIVTDEETGIKKTFNFFVNVINPYKLGYYLLSKNAANESILYCRSTLSQSKKFEKVLIPNVDLGKNPLTLGGMRQYGNSSTDYYNRLVIGVKNASYPVIMIDSREFLPVLLYNTDSYVGDKTNFKFEPTEVVTDPFNPIIYVVNNGKIHVLQKGAIGLHILRNDPKDYFAGLNSIVPPYSNGQYFLSFYDQKNKSMRVVDHALSGIAYNYTISYDQITKPSIFENQSYLTGRQASIGSEIKMVYLMREGNNLISYMVNYNSNYIPSSMDKIAEAPIPGDGNIRFSTYDFRNNFWYVATSKAIYRASHLGLEFQNYVTLPNGENGVIKTFKLENEKLIVATYDEQFVGEKKSSVYVYDINTKDLEIQDKHVAEEVVDVFAGI